MKLVLAEDNNVARRVIEAALTRGGHEVTAVADGEAAVEAYERMRPPLVILDWEMPVVDGLEACRRIRALTGGDRVFLLMVTGRQHPGDIVSALHAGVDDYIVKPATPEHLEARLIIAEQRMALDAARRQAEDALARAQWLAGVGETTIAVQHEINNPLTNLLAEAQLLQRDTSLPESVAQSVGVILQSARRVAAVVKRLAGIEDPHSIGYLKGQRMLDLSAAKPAVT